MGQRVSMKRQPLKIAISTALGVIALLLLITNLPDQVSGILIFYGLMIALTLNFNAFIPDLELNPAHGIGMMVLLSLPLAALPASLWTVTLGSIVGELINTWRSKRSIFNAHTVFFVAQMTISFYVSAQLYNGMLPLHDLVDSSVLSVIVYGLAYSALFFLFFLFEMALDGKPFRLLRAYVPELLLVLFLPIPLAALGTLIITRLSLLAFAIYAISLLLILMRQLEVTRLQRRQIEELHSISEMGKAISANLDLDALLEVVYDQVQNLLNVRSVTVAIYDGTKLQFPLNLHEGTPLPEPDQSEVKTTLLNRVLQNRQPLRFTEGDGRSWLGVPLLSGGHLLGALVVTDPRQFNDDDLRQLNIVASTTGVALENTQFYRQQKERLTQLATLNSIVALLTDTLSPDTVIDTIISSASTIAEASAVAVYLFGEDSMPSLTLARCAGLSDQYMQSPPELLIEGADQPGASPQPVVIANAARDPRATAQRDLMEREGKAAWIELPLSLQGVPIGLLVIYYNQAHEFNPEIVELLRTFANQCAQAISNAHLYAITDEALEQRVGQLLALANIGHHLTAALEVRAICDLVADYARKTTNSRACAVLLLNSAGEVEHWSASGYPPETFSKNRKPSENGAIARSIQLKDTVLVNDSASASLSVAHLPGTRSQIAAPMLWNERVTGVILLDSAQANAYSEEDSYFVNQLANQAVIAIENARLFRKVSEARDRMQVILNTVKEGLILISTEGEIILANPRVALMGLQPETLIGKSLTQLLEDEDLGLAERLGFRTGGELLRVVKELRAPNGLAAREPNAYTVEDEKTVVYVEQQIFPVSDEADQPLGVLLVFYDETEERKLARTREEVSQMLIYDLRSPLTAVTTSLKLLTELTPKDSTIRPLVETTTDAGRRAIQKLLGRVDSLLDVSKMENGFMALDSKPSELATLVDNVCIELSPLAQELGVIIKPVISAELPLLEIDADKVERMLLNLVDNALKFSPTDTTVVVRAHEPGAEGAAPGFVRVDVIDAGPGVPDEYKLMLFDRYVQVRGRKGARRGTGLGLTFCRLVTETHGGQIWIDDNPTGGSIFAFTLPVTS